MNAAYATARQAWSWMSRNWDKVYLLLEMVGLLQDPQFAVEPLQLAVEDAFQPVIPAAGFRRHLRDNLALAAHHRQAGLLIESRRSYREALLLAASATLLAATVATAVALVRWHPTSREG
jgi:hypothetical protein